MGNAKYERWYNVEIYLLCACDKCEDLHTVIISVTKLETAFEVVKSVIDPVTKVEITEHFEAVE